MLGNFDPAACPGINAIAWIPDNPIPTTATRFPAANAIDIIMLSYKIAYKVIGHIYMRRRTFQPAAPLAEMPGLDNHLCFALYAASNHMTRIFLPFLEKLGVTYPQYLVLVALWERGSQGVGDLASTLGMDFGTLSPMLKRIEKKGLVARRRDPADERRVLVSLTPKGLALRKRTQQILGQFYCFLNVPVEELFDLKDRLRRFVRTAGATESEAA
jgi:DNA-binding MarR family transcriptional regulator